MSAFTDTRCFEVVTCCKCGCDFGLPGGLYDKLRENEKSFYCPNGHPQHFCESSTKKLERELASKERALATARRREAELERQRDHAENRRRGEKAAKTRLKNRVAKGVCPCCNRSFANLRLHMANKHPEFSSVEEVADG